MAATNDLLASRVRDALELSLRSGISFEKAPSGFDEALEQACSVRESVPNTFLQAGVAVWFAYFVAIERTHHEITQLHPPIIQEIANGLSTIEPHGSFGTLFQHLFHTSRRASSRSAHLRSAGVPVPVPTDELSRRPSKRPRNDTFNSMTGSANFTDVIETTDQLQPEAIADSDLGQGHHTTDSYLTSLAGDPTRVSEMSWPLAKNLPTVFSHYICHHIIKKNNKAAVRLLFPPNASKCCMYLDIATNQVQYMAKELFNVKIDIIGNQRFISTENGTSIKIEGAVKLRRTNPTFVEKVFGTCITLALSTSMPRLQEIALGEPLTGCVRMDIAGDASIPCSFKVKANVEQLSVIATHLWWTN
ncbi:hypothetical protein NPX13_g2254 [Xylaria arbuscula]|uniref:Uncharacterized protein n=1 Tax=Xylaria arbuscula TaxID=114810 RepID=A0A9W8NK48_9PEZI|nr:hypothetical protein NPX13_g2254 [Xylaria arbuscula]